MLSKLLLDLKNPELCSVMRKTSEFESWLKFSWINSDEPLGCTPSVQLSPLSCLGLGDEGGVGVMTLPRLLSTPGTSPSQFSLGLLVSSLLRHERE